jgi:hypothetical protein
MRIANYFRLYRGSNPYSLALQVLAQSPYRLGFIPNNSMKSHYYEICNCRTVE